MEGFSVLGSISSSLGTPADGNVEQAESVQQFLTFILDEQEYGVDILSVQEIRGRASTTRVPNVPDYIRGVINLRGTIVPVVDLRVRFGMPPTRAEEKMSVIVLKIVGNNGKTRAVGIMVNAVSDVYSLPPDKVKAAPEMGDEMDNEFASGIAIIDDKLLILLDVSRLLTTESGALAEL